MKRITLLWLIGMTFFLSSCQIFLRDDYTKMIINSSVTKKVYTGFHQAFEGTITPMDRTITQAVLERRAQFQEWPSSQLDAAIRTANEERLTESKFFMRMFTPEVTYNDLHQPDSIWKVYLIVGDQKYEARVRKDFSKLAEQQALFPYFDRFSFGYDLSFPIGQAALANTPYQILVTSSVGKAEFNFN